MKENKKEILPATSARSKTERTRKQLEAMESVASLQDQHIVEAEVIKLKSEYLPINEDKLSQLPQNQFWGLHTSAKGSSPLTY